MRFATEAMRARRSMTELCQQFGMARPTGYKWVRRFEARGRSGLGDQKRQPRRSPTQVSALHRERIRRARRRWRHWGARKIAAILVREHGRAGAPSERAIGKWLQRMELTVPRRQRRRRGAVVVLPPLTPARYPNHVWTLDFKGWSRTQQGRRIEPLTVRDLFSRYALSIKALPHQQWRLVQREMKRLFRRYGLPEIVRTDNGHPFSSSGAAGLSRLSAWWVSLGIRLERIQPGHPEQNGSHEQFHAELKAEATQPPSTTLRAAQRRWRRWQQRYNQERPHQALGMKTPATLYRKSRRRWKKKAAIRHPKSWPQRRVRRHGEIKWQGRLRYIGEALIGQRVALDLIQPHQTNVYFANVLLGQLHAADAGGLRPAAYVRPASATPNPDAKV